LGWGFTPEVRISVLVPGKKYPEKGWDIEWRWVPGHVGIRENEEADKLAKEGVYMKVEDGDEVLSWGKWGQRRKERIERVWKEYWKKKETGRAYFGSGRKDEGHNGKRRESIFLFWMRTGHGRMRGTRYRKGRGECDCVGKEVEDRDHVLLKCEKWNRERMILWSEWGNTGKKEEWMNVIQGGRNRGGEC